MATRKPTRRPAAKRTTPLQRLGNQLQAIAGAVWARLATALGPIGTWAARHKRQRTVVLWLAPLAVIALLWATDPDRGPLAQQISVAPVFVWLLMVMKALAIVALAHWILKAIFDYPEADRRSLFADVKQGKVSAAIALAVQAAIFLGLVFLLNSQAHGQDLRTHVPSQARPYLPVLQAEQLRYWPDHPEPAMLAALIEHESGCFALKRKCWNPHSQLKSAREEGAGLGQLTRAYRADGSVRFDALQEMVDRHPALAGLTWSNVYDRADLQIRALVLKQRGDFMTLRLVMDARQRLKFTDVAYNRGIGGVQAERRACGLRPPCDPQQWDGNVERVCLASRAALYGGRSACDISRHHPVDVLARTPKYRGLL